MSNTIRPPRPIAVTIAGSMQFSVIVPHLLYPIEVKLNSRPSRKDTQGIRAFRETYPDKLIAPGLVIAPAEQLEKISENEAVVPWDLI